MRLTATAFITTALACGPAHAQEAQLGRLSWAAFYCATLAGQANEQSEQERLFILGYQSGLSFINALQEGRVTEEQTDATVPLIVMLSLSGPTPDFMLGRVYEAAAEKAYDDVSGELDQILGPEMRRSVAMGLFESNNCILLR
jgi:hypothetical protein